MFKRFLQSLSFKMPDEGGAPAGGDEGGGGPVGMPAEVATGWRNDSAPQAITGWHDGMAITGDAPAAADSAVAVPDGPKEFKGKLSPTVEDLDVPFTPKEGEKPAEEKPSGEETPKAEGEPKTDDKGEAPGEKPEAAAVEIPEAAAKVLLDAAKVLGIQETDPAKIPAAIEAHNVKAAEQAELARAEQDQRQEAAVAESLRESAREIVFKAMEGTVRAEVEKAIRDNHDMDVMTEQGPRSPLDIPGWDKPETWEDPAYAGRLKTYYDNLTTQVREATAALPQWQSFYENEFNARHGAYATEKAAIAELTTKYQFHNADLIADMRRANPTMTAAAAEQIARVTHSHTEKAISTIHTENAGLKASLEAAQAQISGHAKALDDARLEGRNAVLKELNRPNPPSSGLASSAVPPPVNAGRQISDNMLEHIPGTRAY